MPGKPFAVYVSYNVAGRNDCMVGSHTIRAGDHLLCEDLEGYLEEAVLETVIEP